jgi:hydroxypyruvate reductase
MSVTDDLVALLRTSLVTWMDVTAVFTKFQTSMCVDRHAKRCARWSVIAVGKVALSMFEAATEDGAVPIKGLGTSMERALVIAPEGERLPRARKGVHFMHAPHPLPDARSVEAADRALAIAQEATDGLLVLVSGGASSLMAKPAPGISLAKKRRIVDALLRAGAPIRDINVVRRHISEVKGGALARAARDARFVLTLVVSDVLDDAPWDVGSGPTCFDPTMKRDARRVLRRIGKVGTGVPLVETMKMGSEGARADRGVLEVVGSPRGFAHGAAEHLRASGYDVRVLAPSDEAAADLAEQYVQIASTLQRGQAIVRAAEPSVRVPKRHGRGGRSTHLAALVARELPDEVAFMAAATDGVDGSSGTGGAIVTNESFAHLKESTVDRFVKRFDTGPLHQECGTALPHAQSRLNFADVHVLARAR